MYKYYKWRLAPITQNNNVWGDLRLAINKNVAIRARTKYYNIIMVSDSRLGDDDNFGNSCLTSHTIYNILP